ncbi:SDR family NAD(P)-dependent oxidoreductase [Paraglaciecola polaris]|uniref:Uncharacterized protein n=1 Tax=Paraglaciecola polaris LMG 21857 TaxID=1129793 RepID=K6Z4N6_9ALTE|nr:SDR family NAD(P)-dependent oxidoreductase [Paraglaciecola polaris]GAC31186.1 hypothetical protein GPLA_0267 [Paraglaciecola polaris LMG 21857]
MGMTQRYLNNGLKVATGKSAKESMQLHLIDRSKDLLLGTSRSVASINGHVVNITSVGGLVGQPFNEFYCAAKFAVEGYVESVSTYITPNFGINFTNVEPGGIQSEFANNALAQFQGAGSITDDEYRPILEKYIAVAGSRTAGVYQTSEEVAKIVTDSINSPTH